MAKDVNEQTGIEKYKGSYWRFLFKDSDNWKMALFGLVITIGMATEEYFVEPPVRFAFIGVLWLLITLFYNWYCWQEQKAGKTS